MLSLFEGSFYVGEDLFNRHVGFLCSVIVRVFGFCVWFVYFETVRMRITAMVEGRCNNFYYC